MKKFINNFKKERIQGSIHKQVKKPYSRFQLHMNVNKTKHQAIEEFIEEKIEKRKKNYNHK